MSGRVVAGVAAGLSAHGLPVRGVRLALLLGTARLGAGALAYLLLRALVPDGPGRRASGATAGDADDPAEVARLARAQERELRGWLYGTRSASGATSLAAAVERAAAQVQEQHVVPVEVADDAVDAYVSDRGDGFDPDQVPVDRLGVRESVVGRMASEQADRR